MNSSAQSDPGATDPRRPAGPPAARSTGRSKLRLATVGGIAAIAILGGGIAAAAASGAPAGGTALSGRAVAAATGTQTPSEVTSRLVPTGTGMPDPAGSNTESGTAGPAAPAAPDASGAGKDGSATPATPPAPKAHQPHLDGTVTSVSGSTVLIKDHEGFTRTIVTSSTTTYQDGLEAALAVGTRIHAEGKVDSNGTSLDATAIGVDKGPAAGGPGGRGPGGPGGKHDGPPPAPGGAPAVPAPGAAAPGAASPGAAAPGTSAPATSAPAPSTMATTK